MKGFCWIGVSALLAAGCAGGNADMAATNGEKVITTSSGLRYVDIQEGKGKEAKTGSYVALFYTGWLKNGEKFDSNVGFKPYEIKLGNGEVIKGWDEGIVGMKVGGKRKLLIPPSLGYGRNGKGPIPPNADLIFELELVKVG